MGCVESRPEVNNMHSNVFQVVVMEDHCQRHRSARLEVTDTSLVLYTKNKTAIQWPLSCLRRYGFDGEMFSFESGRRCITGPGVYKYKCRRAEALFMLLQLKIQGIAEQTAMHDITSLLPDGYLSPIAINCRLRSDSILAVAPTHAVIVGSTLSPHQNVAASNIFNSHISISSPQPSVRPANDTFYVNSTIVPHEPINAADRGTTAPPLTPAHDDAVSQSADSVWMDLNDRQTSSLLAHTHQALSPRLQAISVDNYYDNPSNLNETNHVYMNVMSDNRGDLDRMYANMGLDKEIPVVPPRLSIAPGSVETGSSHSGTTTTTDTGQQISQINYITVDLDTGNDSSHINTLGHYVPSSSSRLPESPSNRTANEKYSVIDFERTEALLTAKKMVDYRANCARNNSALSSAITMTGRISSCSE